MSRETRNATIKGTMLGFEDHGILTLVLTLDYGVESQGFGGYGMDGAFGMDLISQILKTLEVDEWERLKGKPCRAIIENGKVIAIGHYLKQNWVTIQAIADKYK